MGKRTGQQTIQGTGMETIDESNWIRSCKGCKNKQKYYFGHISKRKKWKSHCALVIQYTSELNAYFASVFKQEDDFDHGSKGTVNYEGMRNFHSWNGNQFRRTDCSLPSDQESLHLRIVTNLSHRSHGKYFQQIHELRFHCVTWEKKRRSPGSDLGIKQTTICQWPQSWIKWNWSKNTYRETFLAEIQNYQYYQQTSAE